MKEDTEAIVGSLQPAATPSLLNQLTAIIVANARLLPTHLAKSRSRAMYEATYSRMYSAGGPMKKAWMSGSRSRLLRGKGVMRVEVVNSKDMGAHSVEHALMACSLAWLSWPAVYMVSCSSNRLVNSACAIMPERCN